MPKRISVTLALALALCVLSPHALASPGGEEAMPPLVRATPRAQRLPTLSDEARALVSELDGKSRGTHLSVKLIQAQKRGTLLRVALELQSLLHKDRGNYLYALYRSLLAHHAENARAWAEHLAQLGVGIGITSGHFENLTHLDPRDELPAAPPSELTSAPMSRWLDHFVSATYRLGYRPFARGNLSEVVQLRYQDGTVLDIDIRVISDNRDPAPLQSMGRPYVGTSGRLFPLRLNRDTTPRLWQAKAKALAAMHQSNREFETTVAIGLAAVMVNMPTGLVVPVSGPGATSSATVRAPRSARVPASVSAPRPIVQAPARTRAAASAPRAPPQTEAAVPPRSSIVRQVSAAPLRRTAGQKVSWPPSKPSGPKPGVTEANAASWRYQRYAYNAYRQGKSEAEILPYATWRRRHFEPVLRGGRPGRPGGPAHQADVKRNAADPNYLKEKPIGSRFPDGVGRPGQAVLIRGQNITPRGQARVIVESDRLIRSGTMPDSAARAQVRDIRKAEPGATIVVTDQANPKAAPLIYPPGKQPPPPGRLLRNQEPVVPYP